MTYTIVAHYCGSLCSALYCNLTAFVSKRSLELFLSAHLKVSDYDQEMSQSQLQINTFHREIGDTEQIQLPCADSESFFRCGPTLTTFFFQLMRGVRIQVPIYAGHHRTDSETPFKWRFAGVPLMAQQ